MPEHGEHSEGRLPVSQPESQQEATVLAVDQEAEYKRAQEAYAAMPEADILHVLNLAHTPSHIAELYDRCAAANELREFVGNQVLPVVYSSIPELQRAQQTVLFAYLRDRLAKGYLWHQEEQKFIPTDTSAERVALVARRAVLQEVTRRPQMPEALPELSPELQQILDTQKALYVYNSDLAQTTEKKPKYAIDIWLHQHSAALLEVYARQLVVDDPQIKKSIFKQKIVDQISKLSSEQIRIVSGELQSSGITLRRSATNKEIEASLLQPATLTLLKMIAQLTHEINANLDFNLTSTVRTADHDLTKKNPDSAHPKGLAFDFTLTDLAGAWGSKEQMSHVTQYLTALMDATRDPTADPDAPANEKKLITVLFEVPPTFMRRNPFPRGTRITPNRHATGIHVHVQINEKVLARLSDPIAVLRAADVIAKEKVAVMIAAHQPAITPSEQIVSAAATETSSAVPQPDNMTSGSDAQFAHLTTDVASLMD